MGSAARHCRNQNDALSALCATNGQNVRGLHKFFLRGTGVPPVPKAETAVPRWLRLCRAVLKLS